MGYKFLAFSRILVTQGVIDSLPHNQADEPAGKNNAVLRKDRASLKSMWPAGYPQTLCVLIMDKFKVIPQISLNEEEFEHFPVWSEHYDWDEIEDIERWGLNRDEVLKLFSQYEQANEHCVYTLLESNPFPDRMRIFIKARLISNSSIKLKGYIMNENAFCSCIFLNGESYSFSRRELLGDLNQETAENLAKALGVKANKIFPISYETDNQIHGVKA